MEILGWRRKRVGSEGIVDIEGCGNCKGRDENEK